MSSLGRLVDTGMTQIDFVPATTELARVVAAVRDDQLSLATPCPGWTVAVLLDHVHGLALGFAGAARKEAGVADQAPTPEAAHLPDDWRTAIPVALDDLAQAWADPAAWEGRTSIAGVESSAPENAATALDEVVVHTWDLARATGQDASYDEAAVTAARTFADAVVAMAPEGVPGLFGPEATPPPDATAVEALVARTGRDLGWSPTAG